MKKKPELCWELISPGTELIVEEDGEFNLAYYITDLVHMGKHYAVVDFEKFNYSCDESFNVKLRESSIAVVEMSKVTIKDYRCVLYAANVDNFNWDASSFTELFGEE